MESRGCLYVCLLVSVLLGYRALGQVATQCRSNERFLSCGGCQKTCKDPAPVCTGVCRAGCYCEEGEVRNTSGHCVKLSECPPLPSYYLHTSEPRTPDTSCPELEEYRFCEPCNRTCDNPNPICPAQCARGCFCIDDLVRDWDGRCVKKENCSTLKKADNSTKKYGESLKRDDKDKYSNEVKPEYELTCGPHQTYKSCQECEKICSSPLPVCQRQCSAGCFCDPGYLKAPSGQCVKLHDCPRAEVSVGNVGELSVEDCQPDEVFLVCGWCEGSCWEPRPACPAGVCTRGCLCRPPLLRHHSGHCVHERDCMPQKCSDPNEEYVCRYGCESHCDMRKCLSRPRRCLLGCHCKLGLLRDSSGKCVAPDNCSNRTLNENRDPVRKLNGSGSGYRFFAEVLSTPKPNTESENTAKSFVELHSFLELPSVATNLDLATNKKPDTKAKTKDEIAPKDLREMFAMAGKYFKDLGGITPFINPFKESDVRNPKLRKIDLSLPNSNSNILKEVQLKEDAKNSEEVTNTTDSHKDLDTTLPKEINMNSYFTDILSVMKEMIPEPMNFTIINYPLW